MVTVAEREGLTLVVPREQADAAGSATTTWPAGGPCVESTPAHQAGDQAR
ncbi:ACT domain-containing protein [Streptomyces longispororuber]